MIEVINMMCEDLSRQMGEPVGVMRGSNGWTLSIGDVEIGIAKNLEECYNWLRTLRKINSMRG